MSEQATKCEAMQYVVIKNVCSLPAGHSGEHSEEIHVTPADPMDDGLRWTNWTETPKSIMDARQTYMAACAAWAAELIAEGTQLGKVGTPEAPDNLRQLALTVVADFPERQLDVWRAGLELMAKTCEITRNDAVQGAEPSAEEAPNDL